MRSSPRLGPERHLRKSPEGWTSRVHSSVTLDSTRTRRAAAPSQSCRSSCARPGSTFSSEQVGMVDRPDFLLVCRCFLPCCGEGGGGGRGAQTTRQACSPACPDLFVPTSTGCSRVCPRALVGTCLCPRAQNPALQFVIRHLLAQ